MKRRTFIAAGLFTLATPAILRSQVHSQTPVVNGKRVRRRLSTLQDNDPFFAAYAKAVEIMHDTSHAGTPMGWAEQAKIHGDHCMHGNMEFFSWHRPYLDCFERTCGALIGDPTFALPYLHWGDNLGRLPAPFFQNGPLNVEFWNDPSNYQSAKWGFIDSVGARHGRVDFGFHEEPQIAGQFTPTALQNIENAPRFDILSGLTENPHGSVHVFTGGDPAFGLGPKKGHFRHGLSPLDPIFWLHHANVDRIWAQSAIPLSDQLRFVSDPNAVYSGMCFDEQGHPVSMKIVDTYDLANFSYTYDSLVPSMLSTEARAIENQILSSQEQVQTFAQQNSIAPIDPAKDAEILGRGGGAETRVGLISRIDVASGGVVDALTRLRLAPRKSVLSRDAVSLETGRIFARFRNVTPQKAADGNTLKVFVDCPYLSDATPTIDQHFAGGLSFFACPPEICQNKTFIVELTEPLRFKLQSGALRPDVIQIQLLAITGNGDNTGAPVANINEVELLTF